MSTATMHAGPGPQLSEILAAIAPRRFRFDPLGLVSGFRAYQVFTWLNARSDAELGRLGLARTDIARTAMDAVLHPGS